MPVERTSGGTSLIDVHDRVLDKGIVIDAWVRVSLVGIDLITVEARVVVASIETYLKYSEAVGTLAPSAKPTGVLDGRANEAVLAENASLRAMLGADTVTFSANGAQSVHRPAAPLGDVPFVAVPLSGLDARQDLPAGLLLLSPPLQNSSEVRWLAGRLGPRLAQLRHAHRAE